MPRPRNNGKVDLTPVLAIPGRREFLTALAELDRGNWGVPFQDRPAPLGMIGGLESLYRSVSSGGISSFLDEVQGSGFHETVEWCRTIGATRAVEYLSAVATLFPEGRVPVEHEERFDLRVAQEPKSPGDGPDPFDELDQRYAGAIDEMAECLRRYVREREEEIAAALAASEPDPDLEQKQEAFALEGLADLEKMVAQMKQSTNARPKKKSK